MSYYTRRRAGSGNAFQSIGGWLYVMLSFLFFLGGFAFQSFREGVYAGAIVALVGTGFMAVGTWIEHNFLAMVGLTLDALIVPVLAMMWATETGHGFAWLWTLGWLLGGSALAWGLLWLKAYWSE